jgi:hypothetical protein
MGCERCDGLMVMSHFIDMKESGGQWLEAWRCTCCGNVVDNQIAVHHSMANPPVLRENSQRVRKQTPLEPAVWL